jgi:hypothetical protein
MKKNGLFLLIFLIICSLLTAGCTSQSPQSVQSSNTVALSTPTVSSTPPPAGWGKHTVAEDHFDIIVPETWTVTEKDTSTIPSYFLNSVSIKDAKISPMSKILYLTMPGSDVSAIVTGVEFSNPQGTVSSNSEILTQFLDASIPAVEQSWSNAAPSKEIDGTQYENIFHGGAKFDLVPDPDIHKVNGYDVKRTAINIANSDGDYLVYCQIFALQNNNRIYFMQVNYINNAASKPAVQTEVSTMLMSLNPWP